MPLPDYYRILGVSRTAKPREIRAAYRRLARRYHPDLNPNDPRAEEALKSINQAYAVLGNVSNRRLYDAQTTPRVTAAHTPPPRPAVTVRRSTAPRRPARNPYARPKVYIKAAFLVFIVGLLAVLAYIVLFQ